MDAARKRNPIMHSTERLKQAEKTLAPKVPADAEPSGDSTLPTACDEVEQLRASFSRKAQTALNARSALTVLFKAGSIGLSRRCRLGYLSRRCIIASQNL